MKSFCDDKYIIHLLDRLNDVGKDAARDYSGTTDQDRLTLILTWIEHYNHTGQHPLVREDQRGRRNAGGIFKCTKCEKEYTTLQKAMAHLFGDWKLSLWRCTMDECTRKYRSLNELRRHQNESHQVLFPPEQKALDRFRAIANLSPVTSKKHDKPPVSRDYLKNHVPSQRNNVELRARKLGNYLSFDGGSKGFSGLSALYILREMFERLEFDYDAGNIKIPEDIKPDEITLPCSWFGLFVGTGPGAVNAILLGRLRMSISQAIEAYASLIPFLSAEPTNDDEERKRNSEAFAVAFTEVLIDAGFSADTAMLDESAPKTAICTVRTTVATPPYLIRSYRTRASRQPAFTVLQTACASVASPDTFLPSIHGEGHKQLGLASAMTGYANPTQELVREAKEIFGESARAAAIISIGTGKVKLINVGEASGKMDVMKQIVANSEQVHRDIQNRLGNTGIYFRLNVDREIEGASDISTMTSAYLEDEGTHKKLDEAMQGLHQQPNSLTLGEINSVKLTKIAMKPRPSLVPHFMGCRDILESLYATHFSERSPGLYGPAISALRGLGGSGKTQIGLKFALEFEARQPGVPIYFLDASSKLNLQADYQTLIRSQGSSYCSASHENALIWLATKQQNWLAILDNADDPTFKLFEYIPQSRHGHVIITTRNDTYGTLAPHSTYHIEGLSTNDATRLLLKISQSAESNANQAYAKAIVLAVGCLPLAVAHAGAYIGMHRCLSTYLETYNKRKSELMLLDQNILPQAYQMSVATTIQMSIDRLSPEARDAMQVFAQLNFMSIAREIIRKSAEGQFCAIHGRPEEEALNEQTNEQARVLMAIFCSSGEWDEFKFDKIIEECLRYSLLRVTTQEEVRFYSMHIVVQSYLKTSSNTVRGCQPTQLAIRLLGSSITIDGSYAYLAYNRLLVPHVRLINMADVLEAGDHKCFANVLREQGSPLLASRHLEYCILKRQEVLGDDHLHTVVAAGDLALSYSDIGRHQDAMGLQEKALKMLRQLLGDGHPDTVLAMNNLASSYRELGMHRDALELIKTVLEMRKQLFGDNHPDTVRAMDNLASTYYGMERYQDALELRETVLVMQTQLLGDDHPDTVLAMYNLASSYHDLGRCQDALELGEKALQMRRKIFGEEHPHTLFSMWNLSFTLDSLAMEERRLTLLYEALPLYEKVYGENHFTIQIRKWIASYSTSDGSSSSDV